jgi:tetratricopeptide (TPR) repeat protein
MQNCTEQINETSALPSVCEGKGSGNDIPVQVFRKWLILLVLLGLIVRIGFFVEHARTPSFGVPTLDQKYYDMVARMLLAGQDLHQLHGFRPLLYPMFLAAFYRLGGSWGTDLAILGQHLLGVGTGVLVALLGARLFRNRFCGIVGGALFMLAPIPLYFEGELLIEPSYTFLICVGLVLHLRAAESGGRKALLLWILSGTLIVLTAQARANIMVFLAIYPLLAAWRWWHSRRWTAAAPLVGLVGAFAMAIPWGLINMKQSDHFHLLPNAGGVALYLGNKRSADGMVPEQERRILAGEQYEDSVEVWAREEYEATMRADGKQPDTDPMAVSRYWTRRTLEEIQADPAGWLALMAKKTWLTFWNAEIPNNKAFAFLQEEFLWLRILPVRWVVLLMLAPAGIWLAVRNRRSDDNLFILLAYVALYSAANITFFICDRYRYPVWPVMAIFAGGGLAAWFETIRTRHVRPALWITASACMMAALSIPNWFGARLPSFSRDYMFRSIAWYDRGRFAEALIDIDRSVDLDPREATALHHRGNVLFALGRLDEASAAYSQSLKLSPDEAAIWNNLGAALQNLGRNDEALNAFRRATTCKPPSLNAYLGVAMMEIQAGHLDSAVATLDQREKRDPTPDAATLALRSIIARLKGDVLLAGVLDQQARGLDAAAAEWAMKLTLGSSGATQNASSQ